MINLRNISSFSHPTPCCFKKKKKKRKRKNAHACNRDTRKILEILGEQRIPLSAILKRGNCTRAKSAPLVRSRPIRGGIHHDVALCPRLFWPVEKYEISTEEEEEEEEGHACQWVARRHGPSVDDGNEFAPASRPRRNYPFLQFANLYVIQIGARPPANAIIMTSWKLRKGLCERVIHS